MKIYDSNQVSIVFAGFAVDGGFAEDEFCRVTPVTDAFTDIAGTDGEVTRSGTNDFRAEIKIILMQTSDNNDKLSALHTTDRKAPNGAGVAPIMIRDKSGRALFFGAEAWVSKGPERVFKKGAEGREWTLRCARLEAFDGGS